MSDELREAAKRTLDEPVIGKHWIDAVACVSELERDAIALARAYLAENPEDSETLVTEEWLRSVGFWERGHSDLCACAPEKLGDDDEAKGMASPWMLINEENFRQKGTRHWCLSFPGCEALLGYDLPTRGDVRRLCATLGIPLKAQVPS